MARRGEAWIRRQRERYRPDARPLGEEEDALLAPHFAGATRGSVRIARVAGIENPPFYREIGKVLLDFTGMSGITFVDTVVVHAGRMPDPPPAAFLFHELVHVVQYEVLGVAEFTRRYVAGWAEGGFSYHAIPLERQAFRLQAGFESGRLDRSVDELVAEELRSGAGA